MPAITGASGAPAGISKSLLGAWNLPGARTKRPRELRLGNARAYADLAREGVIETRPGRGVFIIPKRRVFAREEARRRLEPLTNTFALRLDPDYFT